MSEEGSIALSATAITQANILATATGRIGYAVNYDTIAGLFYLKGGAAFVNYTTYNISGNALTTTCDAFSPTQGCTKLSSPANNPFNFNAPAN